MRQWILIGLILLSAGAARALTLAEIRTQVRRNVRDTSTTASLQRYSDTVLTDLVNEAQREIVNATWALETSTTVALVAGTTYYTMPANYLNALKVSYVKTGSTGRVELKEETRRSLFATNPNWENSGGTPASYYIRQNGTNIEIGFYPAPNTGGVGSARVEYANQAATLSASADVPLDGLGWLVPYHGALVYYASGRLKTMESKADEAEPFMAMFVDAVNRMRERTGMKTNYNPGFQVGSPNR